MIGKFTVRYNGKMIGEFENLICTNLEGEMPNEKNRKHLKDLLDLLSDSHQEIADIVSKINTLLLEADEGETNSKELRLRFADRRFDLLIDLLAAQSDRTYRVRSEVEEIRKNLRTI